MTEQGKNLEMALEQGMEDLLPEKAMRQIILNALDVFARKGLAGTKIKDIAAKAGFSQGFVYNYFQSKDEIFTRIVDLAADGAAATVRKTAALDGTPYEKIFWMTEALLAPDSIAMQHWRLIMIQTAISEAVPEEAMRISRAKMKQPIELLIPILAEGQRKGQIVEANPVMLAMTYFSIIQGLGMTRMQVSANLPFPSVTMILSFLRAPGFAPDMQES